MSLEFGLLIVSGYLLGSVPTGYLLVKWFHGIDIRQHGTGKIGASNVMRVASKRLAILVTILDIGKGALAVWIAQLLDLNAAEQITVGVFAIVGHNWSVFLGFKGGRGVFTTLGVITMMSPWLGLIVLAMPYTLAPIKQVALGVFLTLISLPIFSWFLSQPLGIEDKDRLPVTLGLAALALLGLLTRLITPRTRLSQSVPAAELFFNRLLFDRDIRDRKAWTERNLQQQRKD
ncbi:MAG: glycerol-3-phosphate 1-O-acyltransferase PlsY [Dehalococcoidales bacterium]|nr:glycerol-3-phosphate 1-O-acyltransferase PlsY [Dehalococcoidales bacterium]